MTTTDDTRIGAAIGRWREHLGLTQTRLAEQMVARGHQWHQQTVVKTEKGLRPVRLTEACDLAALLHVDLAQIADVESTRADVVALRGHLARYETAAADLESARAAARSARGTLAAAVGAAADVPEDLRARARALLDDDAS